MIRSFTKWTPQPIGCHETAVGTCSDPPAGLQSDAPDSDWQVVSLMVHQRRPSNSHLDSPVVRTVPLIHVLKNPHVTVQVRRVRPGWVQLKLHYGRLTWLDVVWGSVLQVCLRYETRGTLWKIVHGALGNPASWKPSHQIFLKGNMLSVKEFPVQVIWFDLLVGWLCLDRWFRWGYKDNQFEVREETGYCATKDISHRFSVDILSFHIFIRAFLLKWISWCKLAV